MDRPIYGSHAAQEQRGSLTQAFTFRLQSINSDPALQAGFNRTLSALLGHAPNWLVELNESGQNYLRVDYGLSRHSSEGLGEGVVSLFHIADALLDEAAEGIVAIDEPELSLHPSIQRRVAKLLIEHAKQKQVVLATHSPYFVDFNSIVAGAALFRVYKKKDATVVRRLGSDSVYKIKCFLSDKNNLHVFGLNGREVFFLEDRVILTEGQEDVIWYRRILCDLNIELDAEFFGWGVGGADKMALVARILSDLGFTKVVGILDGNRAGLVRQLSDEFPGFFFAANPTDDVRTKVAVSEKAAVDGLVSLDGNLKDAFRADVTALFGKVSNYLEPELPDQ